MQNIILSSPSWYILLCLCLGALISGILYFRSREQSSFSRGIQWLLALVRGMVTAAIAFLLLQPLLRLLTTETIQPKALVFVDRSNSSTLESNSLALDSLATLVEAGLRDRDMEVERYYFGGNASKSTTDLDSLSTDLSQLLKITHEEYASENIAHIAVLTDGIYNRGSNPLYLDQYTDIPVHTIGLGDTTLYPDIEISNVFYNRIGYKGDRMEIEIDIQKNQSTSASGTITLEHVQGSRPTRLQKIPFQWPTRSDFTTVKAIIDLKTEGLQQFRISAAPMPKEVNRNNNVKDIFVRVLESRKTIAIAARNPHPDIAALRSLLGSSGKYEVDVFYPEDQNFDAASADVIVLHQIPGQADLGKDNLLRKAMASERPLWFIIGTQSNTNAFNEIQDLVTIKGGNSEKEDVTPSAVKGFNLFELEEDWKQVLGNFPPMQAPFGQFVASPRSKVLWNQNISRIDTDYPLVAYGESQSRRMMILAAEGLWRWKLYNYIENENFDLLEGWLEQSIQYLSTKDDKRRFKTNLPKYLFTENETIPLRAELYTQGYELVNEPDVSLTVTNGEAEEFDFILERKNKAYQIDLQNLASGSYTYRASTRYDGESFADQGKFTIQNLELEKINTRADFTLLEEWSRLTGGVFVPSSETHKLADKWADLDPKPVLYQSVESKPIFHWKWLLGLLLLPLCIEWFLRRYAGKY